MPEILVAIWFAAAIVGVAAAIAAVAAPSSWRRPLLLWAGGCLAVAGILGILSIGILVLGLSAACFVAAGRAGRPTQPTG